MILATDIILFGFDETSLSVMLLNRKREPFAGFWSLPGVFVQDHETCQAAVLRTIQDKLGFKEFFNEQLRTFDEPTRDPRGRVISVAYLSIINKNQLESIKQHLPEDTAWFDVDQLPALGFDHPDILKYAIERLKNKLIYSPLAFELVGENFTITQIQTIYEILFDTILDRRNFRKKFLSIEFIKPVVEQTRNGRSPFYYFFDKIAYQQYLNEGKNIEFSNLWKK